jgi:mannose-6-phosphate isomerase
MPYAWGSRTAIADLRGLPSPSPTPEAELWMGAHPRGPARLTRYGAETDLLTVVTRAPDDELGERVSREFGGRFPFLVKVLAAGEPLSIQAHPDMEQARRGFDDEDARGVPIDAPHRNYKDRSHKPELLCALGPFEALSGFRNPLETCQLFAALDVPALGPIAAALSRGDDALRPAFELVMKTPAAERAAIVSAVGAACGAHRGRWAAECAWAAELAESYPADMGVVGALLLNHLTLAEGEAIYLGACSLHAYLRGVGVEIMASSDNVLRGGLTPKHVDVDELLRVVRFEPELPDVLRGRDVGADDAREFAWVTPAREFGLSRVDVDGPARRDTRGPEILCCVRGAVSVSADGDAEPVALGRGQVAFVAGSTPAYRLAGSGQLFRAQVGAPGA